MTDPSDKLPPDDESPYRAPNSVPLRDDRISDNPSVFDEPWLRADALRFEPADEPLPGLETVPREGDPESSIWDEPGLSRELAGDTPEDAVTWLKWYREKAAQTTSMMTWGMTLTVALASGIFAILGAIFLQVGPANHVLLAVVAAPVTEEIMKIALAIWVCEKRPWLFHSPAQILICGLASALIFAAIENVLYLGFGNASPSLVAWRWTVCVLLHVSCSLIASIGVAKVWTEFQREQRMPQLSDGAPWIVAAMILHGTYNLTVTVLQAAGLQF